MRTIVVIPTYNEHDNINKLISQILSLYPTFDILVVDDNSPDGTGRIVEKMAQQSDKIKVLQRIHKDGLGSAYIAGFKHILNQNPPYERIIQMDADFSHHPRYLGDLLEATNHKDIVVGSRYMPNGRIMNRHLARRVLSYCANLCIGFWLKLGLKDCTGGFRCFRRDVLVNVGLDAIKSNGYLFQIEMLNRCLRLGYRVVEIPIIFSERTTGKSKLGFIEVCRSILQLPGLRLK